MQKLRFTGKGDFYRALRQRVDAHFKDHAISKHDCPQMYLKTIIILTLFLSSYIALVFWVESIWGALISGFCFAQSMVLIGFNIQHDGGHKGYSKHKRVNRIMSLTLDLIGCSHYLWDFKHNRLHHTYTNIEKLDDDIHADPFLRLSPQQEWKPWHRLQALYALPIYSLLSLRWVFVSDFKEFVTKRIGEFKLPEPPTRIKLFFYSSKLLYLLYMLVLPSLLHPIWHVFIAFAVIHLVLGLTISIVFQLAHTVESTSFPVPSRDPDQIENEWAIHQLETTANFAPNNRIASWYLGGLNYQIEHHLFSGINHIHYPKISGIVRKTCREFGISYHSTATFFGAVKSHLRFLHGLGTKPSLRS